MAEQPVLSEIELACHTARAEGHARLARDVHDDLGGDLVAIKMALALLARRIPAESVHLLEQAAYVDGLVDRAIDTMHRLSDDIAPLESGRSLREVLALHAAEFTRHSGIPCDVTGRFDRINEANITPESVGALLRIAREALVNIGKHAGATIAEIRLSANAGFVRMDIQDDGKGLHDADRLKPDSYGIRGMLERARAAGGNLSVNSAKPHGTLIRVDIPCE